MSKIYLSSTYQDLVEEREAVYHSLRELGLDVIAMEDYVAADARPAEKCLRDVANADIYIGIFAWRYGFVPESDNSAGLSITQMEYQQARASGLPRLVFLLRASAPWPPPMMDSHTGENGSGDLIARLRDELAGQRLCSDFSSPEELARKVAAAVQIYLKDGTELSLTLDMDLPRRRFVTYMRTYSGATSDRQADARYVEVPLLLEVPDRPGYQQAAVGPLKEVANYTENYVILGPPGSGKTTMLLREAQRLAEDAIGFPAYVSLSNFSGGDADTILDLVATQNRLNSSSLSNSWRQGGDRVRLLVDDINTLAKVTAALAALNELQRTKAPDNSLVLGAPSQAIADVLASVPDVQRLIVLQLDSESIINLLSGYGRDDLVDAVRTWSGAGRTPSAILGQPDLLSAWALSPRGPEVKRPSLARILKTQLHHLLAGTGKAFDRDLVLTPSLGALAYRILSRSQTTVDVDDELLDELSDILQRIYQRYHRRRNIMPADWSAEMLMRNVARSPVVYLDQGDDGTEHLAFSRARFADWYAAWHVSNLAHTGTAPASAVARLTEVRAEGALTQLVGSDSGGAKYVDVIASIDRRMAERVWLSASDGNRKAPSSLQAEFNRLVTMLSEEWAVNGLNHDRRSWANTSDPQRRLQLTCQSPGLSALLDLAADSDPLVRGAAKYQLLHSAERGRSPLVWNHKKNRLVFEADGAGQAVIAGLRLLSAPPGSVARVSVTIKHLETDPFESPDNFLNFLPLPAAALASELLSDGSGQHWLHAVATASVAARLSHDHAAQSSQHGELGDLAELLSSRATDHAALAHIIGDDLGLELPDLPAVPDSSAEAAADSYARLRHSFGPEVLESRTAIPPTQFNISNRIDEVSGAAVKGFAAHSLTVESQYTDGYYAADLAQINISTSAEYVKDGEVHGLVIDNLQGSGTVLPIRLQANVSISVKFLATGTVGGAAVNQITDAYPNAEINCSITINHMSSGSSLLGVVMGDHSPGT